MMTFPFCHFSKGFYFFTYFYNLINVNFYYSIDMSIDKK